MRLRIVAASAPRRGPPASDAGNRGRERWPLDVLVFVFGAWRFARCLLHRDRDLLRLRGFALRQRHRQHAVFVGRAELFTPGLEQKLTQFVKNYATAEIDQKKMLTQSVKDLRLGRFTQAAFDRVIRLQNDKAFTTVAYELQASALTPAPASTPVERVTGTKALSGLITPAFTDVTTSTSSARPKVAFPLALDCAGPSPR